MPNANGSTLNPIATGSQGFWKESPFDSGKGEAWIKWNTNENQGEIDQRFLGTCAKEPFDLRLFLHIHFCEIPSVMLV